MTAPKVSVVMSVHNGERHLREAVDSILNQTFTDFEFIIVDDGSTDETPFILNDYLDPRIVRCRNESNLGLTRSLNRGLAVAQGEYIARMDADDLALPQRLAMQVGVLDGNERVGAIGSWCILQYEDGRRITLSRPCTDVEIRWALLFDNYLPHPGVLLRRTAVERVGGYNEKFAYAQDYDLFSRLVRVCDLTNLDIPLMVLRQSGEHISTLQHEQQQTYALAISERNIGHLLGKHALRRDDIKDLRRLWLDGAGHLTERRWRNAASNLRRLLDAFCQQYTLTHPDNNADVAAALQSLRDQVSAHLTSQAPDSHSVSLIEWLRGARRRGSRLGQRVWHLVRDWRAGLEGDSQ